MPPPRCSCCYDEAFDRAFVERELRRYRRAGPGRASCALVDALAAGGVEGLTVLDIGAGVGAVHQLLLERGASAATDVDASGPYLTAAREEAAGRGIAARVTFLHGDFLEHADGIAAADIVALDRVVCCYGDVDALVRGAAAKTIRRLGIVVPPDGRLAAGVVGLLNLWQRLTGSAFRMHAHPHRRVNAAATAAGLVAAGTLKVGIWRVLVFERVSA